MRRKQNHESAGRSGEGAQPRIEISRRSLLKVGGAATLAAGALASSGRAVAGDGTDPTGYEGLDTLGASRESYWNKTGEYFLQKTVDMSKINQGIIRARVHGVWRDYLIRGVDDAFFKFNIAMRKKTLDVMMTGQYGMYNDAHNGAVGSYGSNRGDSSFILNVAFKGMGWVPKPDELDARIKEYSDNYTATQMKKMQILYAGYNNPDMWDRRFIGSLELYTERDYETHTFLNQMVNPVSTLCTLADESYEFRCIVRLVHHKDPNLTPYEQQVVTYLNYAHDFFHGGPDPSNLTVHNIGVMYFVVEEFDNSPWGMTGTAGGMQRVPAP